MIMAKYEGNGNGNDPNYLIDRNVPYQERLQAYFDTFQDEQVKKSIEKWNWDERSAELRLRTVAQDLRILRLVKG